MGVDDPSRLLEAVRRAWAYAGATEAQNSELATAEAGIARSLSPLLGDAQIRLMLETMTPGAVVDGLPLPLELRFTQPAAPGAPETTIGLMGAGQYLRYWVRWEWNELLNALLGARVDRSTARNLVVDQLLDRLAVCQRAGALALAGGSDEWVRGLLAACDASGQYAGRLNYQTAECRFHGVPPAVVWSVGFPLAQETAPALARHAAIWHEREPVRIDARLSGTAVADVELPPGDLRAIGFDHDPGPALDALLAAAREESGRGFWLFWECEHWQGQEEYFTAGSGASIQHDGADGLTLDLWTELRYPAGATVTQDVYDRWSAEADAVVGGIAAAIGVQIDPPTVT